MRYLRVDKITLVSISLTEFVEMNWVVTYLLENYHGALVCLDHFTVEMNHELSDLIAPRKRLPVG